MMNLEVRHLLLVRAVAEEGSLTRAGTQLNLTQSALSHQLLDLEERLGTRLFHRVGKRMVLAPAGERILQSARRVLDDLTRAEEDVKLLAAERRGVIRLTVECYTCYHWLPPLMKKFTDRHPGVDVRIEVESRRRPVAALVDGTIDVALISSDVDDPRLRLTPLFDDEMVVVVAADHPLAEREFVSARDLAQETLMTYHSLEESTAYDRILRPAGLEPKQWMQVPLTEAMVELIRGGVGVAVMARWSVWPSIESGAVVGVPVTRRGLTRQWKAAVLRTEQIPAYLDAFIEMVAAQPERQRRIPLHIPGRRRAS